MDCNRWACRGYEGNLQIPECLPKIRTVERVFLSEEELQKLASKEFASEYLAQVRDIFLFSCFIGLAYADVQKLRQADIQRGIEGEQ